MAPTTSLSTIEAFLANRRLAFVGLSRNPHKFSVYVFKQLLKRGYEVLPVNPSADELHGHRCYARIWDIHPPVEAVLLMTRPAVTEQVVRECAEAGVRQVWMHRGEGQGAVSAAAVDFCREHGISVVAGECPCMFLPRRGFHAIHGWLRRINGTYPPRVVT